MRPDVAREVKMPLKTSDFDYRLDPGLIAQVPSRRRDQSRLLRLQRDGGRVCDHVFGELPRLLRAGDLLVLNDTRVIPARFRCRRRTGGRIEGLFLKEIATGRWEVMLRSAGRCKAGEPLELSVGGLVGGAAATLTLKRNLGAGCWTVEVDPPRPAMEVLETAGTTPLPPYIRRRRGDDEAADHRRYQTVYADRPGAVAAPTAGLHFTEGVLGELARRRIACCRITLHVGAGTFLPVKTEDLGRHKMHSETYEISLEAADDLNAAWSDGRRIVAVGTTTVRALETAAAQGGQFAPAAGSTDIFIHPPAEFRAVDALVTNFHLPRSTLLMLVAAFCRPGKTDGLGMILGAYQHAMDAGYRFYSYGDAMLIE